MMVDFLEIYLQLSDNPSVDITGLWIRLLSPDPLKAFPSAPTQLPHP